MDKTFLTTTFFVTVKHADGNFVLPFRTADRKVVGMRSGVHLPAGRAVSARQQFRIVVFLAEKALSKNPSEPRLADPWRPCKQIRMSLPSARDRSAQHLNLVAMSSEVVPIHVLIPCSNQTS